MQAKSNIFIGMLDKALDDMVARRELSLEDAFKLIDMVIE